MGRNTKVEYGAREDVPWLRAGSCYSIRENRGGHPWGKHVLNTGADRNRLKSDEFIIDEAHNSGKAGRTYVEERAFAEMWDARNNHESSIFYLLLGEYGRNLTPRERYFVELGAATVVQWLGTNVGSGFVDEARRLATREAERLEPEIRRHVELRAAAGCLSSEQTLNRLEREEAREAEKEKQNVPTKVGRGSDGQGNEGVNLEGETERS